MVPGIAAFVCMCFLGPGDGRAESGSAGVASGPAGGEMLQKDFPKLVTENGKTYRIVSTPFGMMKQPAEAGPPSGKSEKEPAATPKPAAARKETSADRRPAPAPVKAEPAPEAPAIESEEPADIRRTAPATKQEQPGAGMTSPEARGKEAAPEAAKSEKEKVTLNFDDADLYEVIRTMADILKISYIVDPAVRGRVTLHTAGTISPRDLFPVFFQILETNGLTAVKEGAVYNITSLKEAARMPMLTRQEAESQALPPGERVLMQIIPLKNIHSAEMMKILTPFISSEGTMVAPDNSNSILLVDKGVNVAKALKLVESFDLDMFAGVGHRFFRIEYNTMEDIIKVLQDALPVYYSASETDVRLIPIDRLGMLLVMSRQPRVIEKVAQLLKTLDGPNETVAPQLYVYKVKNGQAGELAGLLDGIFKTASETKTGQEKAGAKKAGGAQEAETVKTSPNPFAIAKPAAGGSKPQTPREFGEIGSGTLRAPIKITPDLSRNALIIEAIPSDYQIIQRMLESLDVLPRQVLIEVMIADITLSDSEEFGVEWRYVSGKGGPSTEVLSASMGVDGLTYVMGQTARWSATLSALAKENRVNVLSSPTVLASNDKEAKINISTEVPVASAVYNTTNLSNESMVQTNIQYRNTGIILSVTPHINDNGLVSLTVNQEVSDVAGDVLVGGVAYPSFFQRSVSTNLTVGHNQTIVIGGLIKNDTSEGDSGVPYLKDIPVLGYLFGKNTNKTSRNEMIVLITPRVIADLSAVDDVTRDFRNRIETGR
ncbi:MAG: type II secretion system secretin GspD [Thermodesulfobacteriota bacterium]